MNVSIDFTGGLKDPPSNPRLKPKPLLLFEKNPLSLFTIKSYTCLKCCKKVEVKPGGYLQKNDSKSQNQNPVTSLLCVECFQIKTRSHSPASSRDEENSSSDEQDEEEQNGYGNYQGDSPSKETESNDHMHEGGPHDNDSERKTILNLDHTNENIGKYIGAGASTSTEKNMLTQGVCEIRSERKETETETVTEKPKLIEPIQLNPELLYWFKCTVCEDKFLSHSKLDLHLLECHADADTPAIRCQHCDKSFRAYSSYLSHNSIHMDMIEYLCKYCGQDFSTEKEYCIHLAIHCKSCHECDRCANIYGEIKELNLHKDLMHRETKNVQGQGDITVKNTGLDHFNQSLVAQPQLASFSAAKFTTVAQEQPLQHPRWIPRIRIESNEHQCQTCKVNCPSAKYLASHVQALHASNHSCTLCLKQFTTKTNLQKHQVQAHQDYRPYSCKICPKNFKLNYQLKSHEMTHSTEKNFACSVCGKMFLNKSYANCHYRYSHLGIKYYLGKGKEKRKTDKQQPIVSAVPLNLTDTKTTDNANAAASNKKTAAYTNATRSDNHQVKVKPKRKYTKRKKIEDSYGPTNYYQKLILDAASAEGRAAAASNRSRRSGRMRKLSSKYI